MIVSVIIPTYQRPSLVRDAVASVLSQDFDPGRFEILVVDNAPHPTQELMGLCDVPSRSSVLYIHEPRAGLHNGRHTGAREAQGEILAYIDDDIKAPPGWLAGLVGPYEDREVACVGGRVLPLWEVDPPPWAVLHPGTFSLLDHGDEQRELRWPEDLYGCNLSIRKEVLMAVGGFNPDGYPEGRTPWRRGDGETGLLKKVYATGKKIIYTPAATLYHIVPKHRLTAAYVKQRAANQAISDEYGRIREKGLVGPSTLSRLVKAGLRCAQATLLARVSALREDEASVVYWASRAAYMSSLVRYNLRAWIDADLRHHIFREDYFGR